MLKLTEIWSLPQTNSSTSPNIVSPSLCGFEREGIILLQSQINEETLIEVVDIKSHKTVLTYKLPSLQGKLIGCSINEEKTLIAFTIRKMVNDFDAVFESYIADVSNQEGPFLLLAKSPKVQRVQFLYNDSPETSNRSKFYLLLFVYEESINFLQILLKDLIEKKGRHNSSLQPKTVVLIKQPHWFEFDSRRSCLYILSYKSAKVPSGECTLRCFTFVDKKSFFSEEKEHNLIFEIPITLKNTEATLDPFYFYPFYNKIYASPGCQQLRMVRLRGTSMCLCHQHGIELTSEHQSKKIEVTIYILHARIQFSSQIQITNFIPNALTKTRVFFDSFGDLLLIYIPGQYIQLIDCNPDISPIPTLMTTEFAASLPSSNGNEEPVLVPLSVGSKLDLLCSNDQKRFPIAWDCRNGILSELTLEREVIWKMCDSNQPEHHIQALYLAIMHMQDTELVSKVIAHLCIHKSSFITSEVFNEFLIGTTYVEIRNKIRMLSASPIERLFPFTTLDSLTSESYLKKNSRSIKVSFMPGFMFVPGTKISIREKEEQKRFSLGNNFNFFLQSGKNLKSSASNLPPISPSTNAPPPGIGSFFRDLFGLDNDGVKVKFDEKQESEEDLMMRKAFFEGLIVYLGNYYPKEKTNCSIIAKEYWKLQGVQSNQLLKIIKSSTDGKEDLNLFRILEHLYCALEELAFPFPSGFNHLFCQVGFQFLPRSQFLQYINRRVFILEESIISEICNSLNPQDPGDADFLFFLLVRLPNQEQTVAIMKRSLGEHFLTLPQHLIASVPSKNMREIITGSNNRFVDMEEADDSPFIPLSVFLNLIHQEKSLDFPLIQSTSQYLLGQTLGIQFSSASNPNQN